MKNIPLLICPAEDFRFDIQLYVVVCVCDSIWAWAEYFLVFDVDDIFIAISTSLQAEIPI